MRITVIIPTYKRTEFLKDALSSILNQDFPKEDFEVLLVDNSEHPTPSFIERYDSLPGDHLRYIHEPQNGLEFARRAGARSARGDILVYVDDDVICPNGWLAAMAKAFENPDVMLVGGKVDLHFEAAVPDWVQQFHTLLSKSQFGAESRRLKRYESVIGCNMGVRRKVWADVGGFNPEVCSGDPWLIRYRGDGECGFSRKIHDAGLIVWYEADAWLHHRVPASRMTLKYMKHRIRDAGVETVYRLYRYDLESCRQLALPALKFGAKALCHWALKWTKEGKSPAWFGHHVSSLQHFHSVVQCGRLLCSKKLRAHTKAPTYLV